MINLMTMVNVLIATSIVCLIGGLTLTIVVRHLIRYNIARTTEAALAVQRETMRQLADNDMV